LFALGNTHTQGWWIGDWWCALWRR
jgi:hypothetical protein